jgi:hypothetical protein
MVLTPWNGFQTGISAGFRMRKIGSKSLQNLDATGLSPYTSAVPGNGHDFGPPRDAIVRSADTGMEEDFLQCLGAAN